MRNPLTPQSSCGRAAAVFLLVASGAAASSSHAAIQSGAVSSSATTPARAATDSDAVTISGVITDSLNGGYLGSAIVSVSGTPRMAISDSLGRFRIDRIAPGRRRIDVFHPFLDEIGMALVTPPMELRPNDTLSLNLAFPSAATIVRMLCRADDRKLGPAAVFGQILDAESEQPIEGARISVEWYEYVFKKNKQLDASLMFRGALSAADGHFRVCGLPAEFTAGLSASFKGDTTAKIAVRFEPIMAVTTLRLSPNYASATAQDASAPASAVSRTARPHRAGSLTGKVMNSKGEAIAGARVAVDRPGAAAITGKDGRFALNGIRPGTRSLLVRRIGFQPVEVPVDVSTEAPQDLIVQLADFVPQLDTVVVTAIMRDLGLERVGFARRRKTGMGRYLGPEEIERRHAFHFTDLFAGVPTVRRSTYADGRPVLVGRPTGLGSGCVNFFVDDVPWYGGGVEDFIMPAEVGAIEVYSSAFTPGQFQRPGAPCETVVVWTKLKLRIF